MKYTALYTVSALAVVVGLPLSVAGLSLAIPAYAAALGILLVAFGLCGVVAVLTESTPLPVATVGWASDSVPVAVGWQSDKPARKPRTRAVKVVVAPEPVKVANRTVRPAARATKVTSTAPRPESVKRPRTRKAAPPS